MNMQSQRESPIGWAAHPASACRGEADVAKVRRLRKK
jgi:hypothetical protein